MQSSWMDWEDIWNNHYTETYWHLYDVYGRWFCTCESDADDGEFLHLLVHGEYDEGRQRWTLW